MVDSNNIAALIRERQDKFIETRTIIESEVNKFLDSIAALDEDVRTRCGYVNGANAKSLLPALWAEPFDVNTYNKQLAALQMYIRQVMAVRDEINREAQVCLQQ